MRVPHPTTLGRVRSPKQSIAYSRSSPDANAFGAGVAAALGQIGVNVSALAEQTAERNERTQKFQSLTELSKFETAIAERVTELKRTADPSAIGFVDLVDEQYNVAAEKFINSNIPPDLQEEFRYRVGEIKQRIIADSLEFQYTQQDAFYKAGLETEYIKAKTAVEADPAAFEEWTVRMIESVGATDLANADKVDLARQIQAGLASIVYGKRVENIQRDTIAGGDADAISAPLLRDFEGFRGSAYWDVNAYRAGYGSDTVTRADGTVEPVTENTTVSLYEAELDLARRIKEFRTTAVTQVGLTAWQELGVNAQAALVSVTYNYGSLPDSVVRAAQTGDREEVASAVENLSSNKERRKKEAATIRESTSALAELDSDPMFENVPFEDRMALQEDAMRTVTAEETNRIRQLKTENEAALNSLYVSLHDGNAGQAQIDEARRQGILTDVDDIEKAEKILEDYDKHLKDRLHIQSMLDNPSIIYNPNKDNGAFNSWLGEEGLSKVSAKDQEYFNDTIIPAVQQLQDIPTDLVGQLIGMSRANDMSLMQFAYDNLRQLEELAPEAFIKRTPDDLAARVDAFRYMRGSATEEEIFNYLRGGRNAQEVNTSLTLDKEAASILKELNVSNLATDLTYGWDADVGNWPAVQVAVEREYISAFKYYYRATRDEGKAKAGARRQLNRVWGPTKLGGRGSVAMRLPLEKVYPAVDVDAPANVPPVFGPLAAPFKSKIDEFYGALFGAGGYDIYNDQIRTDFGITDDETYQLQGDAQTVREWELYKLGELNRLPSYKVIKYTEDEIPIPLERRWFGDPNATAE